MSDENPFERNARLFAELFQAIERAQGHEKTDPLPAGASSGEPSQIRPSKTDLTVAATGPHWMPLVPGQLPHPMKILRAENYPTHDLVCLQCDFRRGVHGTLYVNRLEPIELKPKQLLVLLLLVQYMPDFLTAEGIADLIAAQRDRLLQEQGATSLEELWPYPVESDVRKVVHQVRNALIKRKGNRDLIETGRCKLGYRLGTPPHCVYIAWSGAHPELRGSRDAR